MGDDRARIERELTILDHEEQKLRAAAFLDQTQQAASTRPVIAEALDSPDPADRVRMTVVGEGQLHLLGPLAGVNAITRMIYEIDQPVGEVKIGIHVVQFSEMKDEAFEGFPEVMERCLSHARMMSQTSQALFRAAMGKVAARYQAADPSRFEEAFFFGPCVQSFRNLNGAQATISLPLLDSRDIVTTLYLAGLATQETRRDILMEFQRLVATELPRLQDQHERTLEALLRPHVKSPSVLARLTRTGASQDADNLPSLDVNFTQTISYLNAFGSQPNSANAVQVATIRFQRHVRTAPGRGGGGSHAE